MRFPRGLDDHRMVVVAETALEMIIASVAHEIVNIYKRTIILRRGNAPLCGYRRPRLGGKHYSCQDAHRHHIAIAVRVHPVFLGFPQVHFGPGDVINGIPVV
jgi:hypothetical protein